MSWWCSWRWADRSDSATPAAAITSATICTRWIGSARTAHDTTAPINGAVAKMSCPRAAPSCCAPRTHVVIETLCQPPRRDSERRAQVEQSGQNERRHVVRDDRYRWCRSTEQDRGDRAVPRARARHHGHRNGEQELPCPYCHDVWTVRLGIGHH